MSDGSPAQPTRPPTHANGPLTPLLPVPPPSSAPPANPQVMSHSTHRGGKPKPKYKLYKLYHVSCFRGQGRKLKAHKPQILDRGHPSPTHPSQSQSQRGGAAYPSGSQTARGVWPRTSHGAGPSGRGDAAGPAERITLLERQYMASMGSQRNKGDAAASEEVVSPFLLASLVFFLVGCRGSLGFKFYWGGVRRRLWFSNPKPSKFQSLEAQHLTPNPANPTQLTLNPANPKPQTPTQLTLKFTNPKPYTLEPKPYTPRTPTHLTLIPTHPKPYTLDPNSHTS